MDYWHSLRRVTTVCTKWAMLVFVLPPLLMHPHYGKTLLSGGLYMINRPHSVNCTLCAIRTCVDMKARLKRKQVTLLAGTSCDTHAPSHTPLPHHRINNSLTIVNVCSPAQLASDLWLGPSAPAGRAASCPKPVHQLIAIKHALKRARAGVALAQRQRPPPPQPKPQTVAQPILKTLQVCFITLFITLYSIPFHRPCLQKLPHSTFRQALNKPPLLCSSPPALHCAFLPYMDLPLIPYLMYPARAFAFPVE